MTEDKTHTNVGYAVKLGTALYLGKEKQYTYDLTKAEIFRSVKSALRWILNHSNSQADWDIVGVQEEAKPVWGEVEL